MAAENTTPATWTRTAPGVWADGTGYVIEAVIGYRCAASFLVTRPDGRTWPDAERSLTAAKSAVAVAHAIAAGRL